MMCSFKSSRLAIALVLVLSGLLACQAEPPPPPPPPVGELTVDPASIELAFPGMLGVPIKFTVSSFGPKEIVTVEMEVPEGVVIKGIEPGETAALGFTETDESGNATIQVGGASVILTFLRGELSGTGSPIPTSFGNPIPAGVYNVIATGSTSGTVATCTITCTHPAK